jgi:hypothetical protein
MPDKQTTQKRKNERWVFVRGLTSFHLTADVDEPFLKITAGACEDRRLNHRFDFGGQEQTRSGLARLRGYYRNGGYGEFLRLGSRPGMLDKPGYQPDYDADKHQDYDGYNRDPELSR